MTQSGAAGPARPTVLRGSPQRRSDFKEQLQLGYVGAIAAAAGCVLSKPEIDEGIDLTVTHRSDQHTFPSDKVARLEVQLKATAAFVGRTSNHVAVDMRRDRWEYYRANVNTLHKIVVILSMPEDPAGWVTAKHDSLSVFHCAYWVNVANAPETTSVRPIVRAPRSQIFDDAALCGIMARIGKGGRP